MKRHLLPALGEPADGLSLASRTVFWGRGTHYGLED